MRPPEPLVRELSHEQGEAAAADGERHAASPRAITSNVGLHPRCPIGNEPPNKSYKPKGGVMAEMVRAEWHDFVDEAVDELLSVIGPQLAAQMVLARPTRERPRVFGLEDELASERVAGDVRRLLSSYSMQLIAAGAASAAARCDDGSSTVDCDLILRPDKDPHYRCVGHAPPHCYDANGYSTRCP